MGLFVPSKDIVNYISARSRVRVFEPDTCSLTGEQTSICREPLYRVRGYPQYRWNAPWRLESAGNVGVGVPTYDKRILFLGAT